MSEALLIAWALVAGVDWRATVILAVSLIFPLGALVAVGIHVIRNRGGISTRSAVFCQSVARELRSGGSLRSALAEAARVVGMAKTAHELDGGRSLSTVLPALAAHLPEVEVEIVSLVEAVAVSGSASSSLFEELGDLALAQVEMGEEIRVATAPARASAVVLLGLPVAYLGFQLSNGALADLLGDPAQTGLALAGFALAGSGVIVSWLLVRRAL